MAYIHYPNLGRNEIIMLTVIRIGNFKAFADTQRMPIRPLTLIYGSNSAGKATAPHGLLLWRSALNTADLDVHETSIGDCGVDLGGFGQYVHRGDLRRHVEWGIEVDIGAGSD